MCVGGGGGGGTHYISVGKEVQIKGVLFLFAESVWSGRGGGKLLKRTEILYKQKDNTVNEEKSHGNGIRKANYASYEAKSLAYMYIFSCNGSIYFCLTIFWKGVSITPEKKVTRSSWQPQPFC